MASTISLPLLQREYIGFSGFPGHLKNCSEQVMPEWCISFCDPESLTAISCKLPAFRILVEMNRNYPTNKDSTGRTPVHLICSVHSPGQSEVLQVLCSADQAAVNVRDRMLKTPFHHALSTANLLLHEERRTGTHLVSLIRTLIDLGADVDALDDEGISPLHLAMDAGQLSELPIILKMLLDAGADVSRIVPCQQRRYGFLKEHEDVDPQKDPFPQSTTVIHQACWSTGLASFYSLVVLLSRENVNIRDCSLRTPLHALITSLPETDDLSSFRGYLISGMKDEEIFILKFDLLASLGADINAADTDGKTPLCDALLKHESPLCLPAIATLFRHGARANCKFFEIQQITPLHLLCQHFKGSVPDLLPIFLDRGGEINGRDAMRQTPLFYAMRNSNCDVHLIECLISNGADVRATDKKGENCLHVFCSEERSNFAELAECLVAKGCAINGKDTEGRTPLLTHLMSGGVLEHVETLLNLGADVNAQCNFGSSPLHVVCETRRTSERRAQIVDLLIRSGATVDAKNESNYTPLLWEMKRHADEEIVRLLLLAGADPNHCQIEGPLHLAASNGNFHLINLLLGFGANVNLPDIEGRTPLHRAAENNEGDPNATLVALIDGGADPTIQDYWYLTPLMLVTYSTERVYVSYMALRISTRRYKFKFHERRFLLGSYHRNMTPIFLESIPIAFACNEVFIGNVTVAEFLLLPAERARRMLRNPENRDIVIAASRPNVNAFAKQKLDLLDHLNDLERESMPLLNLIHSEPLPLLVLEHIWSYLTYPDRISISLLNGTLAESKDIV